MLKTDHCSQHYLASSLCGSVWEKEEKLVSTVSKHPQRMLSPVGFILRLRLAERAHSRLMTMLQIDWT